MTEDVTALAGQERGRGSPPAPSLDAAVDRLTGQIEFAAMTGSVRWLAEDYEALSVVLNAVSTPDAETIIQAAIDSSPEPLRRLGEYLADLLDEAQWARAEKLLLAIAVPQPDFEPPARTATAGDDGNGSANNPSKGPPL